MLEELKQILPANRIRSRYIDVISFASDAGFYHLVPKAVVQPISESEIQALFQFSHQHKIPLVFRTGGTSLSGQSITDGLLVDLSQFWGGIQVEADGNAVRVQPGITGAMVNAHLRKHKRKIGPDPSSINSAMMGGILSNNSSGMCCGVTLNSYHTTKYIRFILPDGQVYDTRHADDYVRFEKDCNEIYQTLQGIRNAVEVNEELRSRIRYKYTTKNTVGYSLNAFVDFNHPLDILAHLLIGAEGTLAFISEAVLETVPDYPFKSTALLYFDNIYSACGAIAPLTELGAAMVELIDRASLRAVEDLKGMPAIVKTLPQDAAALLIEFQANTTKEVNDVVRRFVAAAANFALLNEPVFTTDAAERDFLWKVRKGLFPAVGAVRASGTTVILEDLLFPVEKLGDAILDLQTLFKKYAYDNAIIFGHAKDGNIHFVVTQSFGGQAEVERYDRFLRDVVALVVHKYDGSLKAEHGTGRNMAPFVETEWGGEAYDLMKRIKQVIDPEALLNPGVIINDDQGVHIKNLKALPVVESEVDKCIECGYCEHKCPSRDLTATPRRRIVIRRALQQLLGVGDTVNYKKLLAESAYEVMETCAVDGMCASACPVDINTGDLVKRLRRENHSPTANRLAVAVAKRFGAVENITRIALKTGIVINKVFGANAMTVFTSAIRKIVPAMPLWSDQITYPPVIVKRGGSGGEVTSESIVYFPSCISRTMGSYPGKEKNSMEAFMSICLKSKIQVRTLDEPTGTCCGQIFSSKGFNDAYQYTANSTVEKLWRVSDEGKCKIVIDVSSCAHTLQVMRSALNDGNKKKYDRLIILDSIDFLHDVVMPRAVQVKRAGKVVLHPVCSLEKMKTTRKLIDVAKHFAAEVVVPETSGCCGMAGDRGFLFPELTQSATKAEALAVNEQPYDGYYSSTRTCEMAMSVATKQSYTSILYLVDEAMTP